MYERGLADRLTILSVLFVCVSVCVFYAQLDAFVCHKTAKSKIITAVPFSAVKPIQTNLTIITNYSCITPCQPHLY